MKGCCCMTDYFVTVKAEVLYEKANSILAKYEKYLDTCETPLECIESIYKTFCVYSKRIIMCSDEKSYKELERNVNEYDTIIENVFSSALIGA